MDIDYWVAELTAVMQFIIGRQAKQAVQQYKLHLN